jgi:hypothetical protein
MKISKQDTDKFKDKVEELIRKYYSTNAPVCSEDFLMELCKYVVEQSKNYIPIREELVPSHRTGVNDTQLDFNLIMFSIVSISWAVRMRKVKSEEGQCHTHKTNCDDTRKFHREIYQQWIDVVEEALEALRSDPPVKTNLTEVKQK